jgi:hypothetical protein
MLIYKSFASLSSRNALGVKTLPETQKFLDFSCSQLQNNKNENIEHGSKNALNSPIFNYKYGQKEYKFIAKSLNHEPL